MSHEIEVLADGSAAAAFARTPAWHQLGTVAPGPMTAEEMLDLASLSGWNVRRGLGVGGYVATGKCPDCKRAVGNRHTQKCPIPVEQGRDNDDLVVTEDDTADLQDVPGYYPVLRTVPVSHEEQIMGIVGPDHTPVQNEEFAEFLTAIADTSGAVFETGGSLRHGADVFMSLKMPEGIKVGGDDAVDLYLLGLNNHTGRRKLQVLVTPVRVVCANTERAALGNHRSRYSFRHTPGISSRMLQAREALKITFDYRDAFAEEAEKMIKAQMTNDQFDQMIKKVWPGRWDKKITEWRKPETEQWETLRGLFKSAETQEGIRGTAWAGYQAVTEYLDWGMPVMGNGTDEEKLRARSLRNFDGQYDQLKLASWNITRELASVK